MVKLNVVIIRRVAAPSCGLNWASLLSLRGADKDLYIEVTMVTFCKTTVFRTVSRERLLGTVFVIGSVTGRPFVETNVTFSSLYISVLDKEMFAQI